MFSVHTEHVALVRCDRMSAGRKLDIHRKRVAELAAALIQLATVYGPSPIAVQPILNPKLLDTKNPIVRLKVHNTL